MAINFNYKQGDNQVTISEQEVINMFHTLYYSNDKQTWGNTRWMGRDILKCPLDIWIYQELIYEYRPDIIIETGTFMGASAHYLGCMCDMVDNGRVITIDVEDRSPYPEHPRVEYWHGGSDSAAILNRLKQIVSPGMKVIVILDSDHSAQHVTKELNAYCEFVPVGSYMIVEDSNINGYPVRAGWGPGPMEAIDEFMRGRQDWIIDTNREKFMLTFNPKGYLKRIK